MLKATTAVALAVAAIKESETNTRKDWGDLKGLALSIGEVGLLQPITVRTIKGGYEVICGARRYRAARLAGATSIDCFIKQFGDVTALQAQLVENIHRHNIHPLDIAESIQTMMRVGKLTTAEIALKIGKGVSFVHRVLMLLRLIPELQQQYRDGKFGNSVADSYARMLEVDQRELVNKAVSLTAAEAGLLSRTTRERAGIVVRAHGYAGPVPEIVRKLRSRLAVNEWTDEELQVLEAFINALDNIRDGIEVAEAKEFKRQRITNDAARGMWVSFCKIYPPRSGARNAEVARQQFERSCRMGKFDEMMAGVKRFRQWADAAGKTGTEYVPMMSTWLDRSGWLEEYTLPKSKDGLKARSNEFLAAMQKGTCLVGA